MNLFSKPLAPREFPRSFVPETAALDSWSAVEPLLRELEGRILDSPQALVRWLNDLGELSDVLNEEETLRSIYTTRFTDDEAGAKEYQRFLSEVDAPSKSRFFSLFKKYLDCPHRAGLPETERVVFDRSVENLVFLFREANVPLETEEEELSNRYRKLSGSLTVYFEDREQTLQQMARYLESPDRLKREEAWRLIQERRLRQKESFDDLYDEMRRLREQIAANADFQDYRGYAFQKRERFDYGPAECEAFHEGVEKTVVPLLRKLQRNRARRMGLSFLRPWDLQNDPEGRLPLAPFRSAEELTEKTQGILGHVAPRFGEQFALMKKAGLLDLESRKGKAPGGYNTTLAEARLPFIFMNSVGLDSDLRTLFHESGHAMHSFAARNLALSFYRQAPIEFCEVASMSMELLVEPYVSEFYPDAGEQARSSLRHFESLVTLLPWIAQIDAFQHWVYTNPNHLRAEREKAWLSLCERFGGDVDWGGLEGIRAVQWHRQLHLFECPFYYIEYGIAQLGALQIWRNAKRDRKATLEAYQRGLAAGGSLSLPDLFKAAGIRFDFSVEMLKPLLAEIEAEIDRLERSIQ